MGVKVCLGIPTNRGIKPKTAQCLLDLVNFTSVDVLPIVATEGYTISENRNYLAAQSVIKKCDYLLFVDDDMTFPRDMLDKMLSLEKKIVGTVAHSRMKTENTHVMTMSGQVLKTKDVPLVPFQAKAVGTGVMLIKTDVFKTIDQPFFHMKTHESGYTLMGEDYWFCDRAEQKGIEIWIDPSIKIGHLGDYEY